MRWRAKLRNWSEDVSRPEMARAVQRTAARRDFVIHYAYLLEHAGFDVAARFLGAVEKTYADLAQMPGMGSPAKVTQGTHAGVRLWPIRGFGNYLVAYRSHGGDVAIERLLHAKQDYQRVLK
jgi:toxin ParE1/3/4